MDYPVNAASFFRQEQEKIGQSEDAFPYLLLSLAGLVDPDAQIPSADHADRIMKIARYVSEKERTIAARAAIVAMINSYQIRPLPA